MKKPLISYYTINFNIINIINTFITSTVNIIKYFYIINYFNPESGTVNIIKSINIIKLINTINPYIINILINTNLINIPVDINPVNTNLININLNLFYITLLANIPIFIDNILYIYTIIP